MNHLVTYQQFNSIIEENNYLRTKIKHTVTEYEQKINEIVYENDKECEKLKKSLCDKTEEVEKLTEQLNRYNVKVNVLNQTIEEKNKTILDLEERYRVSQEYVSLLPTFEESDKLKRDYENAVNVVYIYKKKLATYETRIKEFEDEQAQLTCVLNKSQDNEVIYQSQINSLTDKIKRLQLLTCKKEDVIENNWQTPVNLVDDLQLTLDHHKQELDRTKQELSIQKETYEKLLCKYESKVDELTSQLESESETINTLRKELFTSDDTKQELEEQLKNTIQENQNILGNMDSLKLQLSYIEEENRNPNSDKQRIHNLLCELLRQIQINIRGQKFIMNAIIQMKNKEAIDIMEFGENIDLSMMYINEDSSVNSIYNIEWLQDQINILKKMVQEIQKVKDLIREHYLDLVGSDLQQMCKVQ